MLNFFSALSFNRMLGQGLPASVDVETTSPDAILKKLLSQTSLEDVETLAKASPSVQRVFKKHRVPILRGLIAPEAWRDAVACVDRRLRMGRAARVAFDQDYEAGAVADFPRADEEGSGSGSGSPTDSQANMHSGSPQASPPHPKPTDRGQWDLDDLCELVKTVDRLIRHIGQVPSSSAPGKWYGSFESWEAAWEDRRELPRRNMPHPLGDDEWLEEDQGTEDPQNFHYAFARHVRLDPNGARHEGMDIDENTRARLQRAFFRLEFIRRAYYNRPLFPRGARWQTRTAAMEDGRVQGAAGETFETRLARAEKIFRGWCTDDFLEVTCAFKATLNFYAVAVSDMMDDFRRAVDGAVNSDEKRRVDELCEQLGQEIQANAEAVGLQWETDPLTGESDYPMWGIRPDGEFYAHRAQLMDDREELERFKSARSVHLARGEFDALRCTIFKSDHVSLTPWGRKIRVDPARRIHAKEAHPELEMSRFFHVLCSLPLKFLGEFIDMPEEQARCFLKSSYWAVSRIKASRTPMFLSGEVRAWSSKPAGESPRYWDHQKTRRLFPDLSVRAAAMACVEKVYKGYCHRYEGYRITIDLNNGTWAWRWNDVTLPTEVWEELRSKITYKSHKINSIFGMSDKSWQSIWRSDRDFERLIWTGPMMETPRWEGYGHTGRLDPNECYCHVGQGCGLCTPLPDPEIPEWSLLTKEEQVQELDEQLHLRNPDLASWYPELAKAILERREKHPRVPY